eukprot:678074-Pyramimonas_sp.AAC.1
MPPHRSFTPSDRSATASMRAAGASGHAELAHPSGDDLGAQNPAPAPQGFKPPRRGRALKGPQFQD